MKVIVFDIYGRFAHFRKFYTNSSSLSYSMPPRTTVTGMVAAILGFERDSYYERLNSEKLKIAVRKLTTTKKLLQTLNYIRATSMSELINPKSHTQVPFEILTGENGLGFRIYLTLEDKFLFDEIEIRIRDNKSYFTPYLGSASFGCNFTYVDTFDALLIESKDYVSLNTVIRMDKIQELNISNYSGRLTKERMPVDFSDNRIIKEVTTYVYDEDGNSIEAKINDYFIKLSNGENIIFM